MKVKVQKIRGFDDLYFCPNCKKGHQVEKGQSKCDVCGIDLEWEEENVHSKK